MRIDFLFVLCLSLFSITYAGKAHDGLATFYPIGTSSGAISGDLKFFRKENQSQEDIKDPEDDCKYYVGGRLTNITEAGEYVIAFFFNTDFQTTQKPLFSGCEPDEHLNFTVGEDGVGSVSGCFPHSDVTGLFLTLAKRSWCTNKNDPKEFKAYGVVKLKEGETPDTTEENLVIFFEWKDGNILDPKNEIIQKGINVTYDEEEDAGCVLSPTESGTLFGPVTAKDCGEFYAGMSKEISVGNRSMVGVFGRAPGVPTPDTFISTNPTLNTLPTESESTDTKDTQPTNETKETQETKPTDTQVTSTDKTDSTKTDSTQTDKPSNDQTSSTDAPKTDTATVTATVTDGTSTESNVVAPQDVPSRPGLIVGIVFASLILFGMIVIMIRRNRVAARKDGFKRMYGEF